MDEYTCFLVVEHSHSEPEARFTLVDEATYRAAVDTIDSEGWIPQGVDPIIRLSEKGTFTSPIKLIEWVKRMNLTVSDEVHSWADHD